MNGLESHLAAISSNIAAMRRQRNETYQSIADACGFSRTQIWALEIGKSKNPGIDTLFKIAKHFGITISELIGETKKEASSGS